MAEHAHAHAHHDPEAEYAETPPGAGHEHTDAHAWIIVKFLGWLFVSAIVIHIGLGFMYELLIDRAMEVGEQRYPLAADQEQRLPPAPRLQQFPQNDIYQFRLSEQELLNGYGWMNREAGVVHVPVAEAMRLMVSRGTLTSRTTENAEPAPTPGLMPSDASSGRTMERRRQ